MSSPCSGCFTGWPNARRRCGSSTRTTGSAPCFPPASTSPRFHCPEAPAITAFLPTYRDTFVETACTLVEPANPAALAEAMVEVVNQPPAERAIRLAEARKIVEREYDDTVIKQRLWALYAELSPRP